MPSDAEKDAEIVTDELARFWLRPGEKLLFGCAPTLGHVRARIGDETRPPHDPIGVVPALDLGQHRGGPGPHRICPKWTAPTIRWSPSWYWLAQHQDQRTVRFGDDFAHSQGKARLVASSVRVAVVYPTRLLGDGAPPPFTTFCERDSAVVRGIGARSPAAASGATGDPAVPRSCCTTRSPCSGPAAATD